MKVVREEDAIEVKSEKELYEQVGKLFFKRIHEIEERTGKKRTPINNFKNFDEIDKISKEMSPFVMELQKKYDIELSEKQVEDVAYRVAEVKYWNEKDVEHKEDKENENQYILNRFETLLALLEDKKIVVGNVIVERSDNIRMSIIKCIEEEMEDLLFDEEKIRGFELIAELQIFGYDVDLLKQILKLIKKSMSLSSDRRTLRAADGMKRIALCFYPDGMVLKNGKLMTYCPKKEVLFIVDILILTGVLKDENDSDDDKYSKYKRFLEVKELIKKAEFEAGISR